MENGLVNSKEELPMIAKAGKLTLAEIGRSFKSAMAHADTGPLEIAADVIALCDAWDDDRRQEAGGRDYNEWLTMEMGNKRRGYAYFKVRLDARNHLGESVRRSLHHEVAVYIMRSVPDQFRLQVKTELEKQYIRNNRCPLNRAQAMPIINAIVGKRARLKTCRRCAELEARVAELEALTGQ